MSPCTAETRSAKMFSKKTYETGVVIVTCPGCKGNHLIADRLGWFGEPGSIEDYLSAQGQGITLPIPQPAGLASVDKTYTSHQQTLHLCYDRCVIPTYTPQCVRNFHSLPSIAGCVFRLASLFKVH